MSATPQRTRTAPARPRAGPSSRPRTVSRDVPRPVPRGASRHLPRRGGFTLVEVILAVLLIGLLAAIATPAVGRLAAEASVRRGAAELTVGVAQARALAVRHGRPSVFVLDTVSSSYHVVMDTTLAELGPDTLIARELPELRGAVTHLSADPGMLCFDARGVGRGGGGCGVGLTVVLGRGGWVDTLAFSATGRLLR
ncbi:MAG TPA: prepilin-type N-terminal cleavage/methylation domain-containing protein [Longimicrobiales bacterium]|nr:prepilin-type N-terminal cleavage/methylation domain-containing protein [Longimicrobiales bacterium]